MAGIQCATELTNYINDYNAFLAGADTADVTLSDGFITPSYQKFALSELLRTGVKWSATEIYQPDDVISRNGKLYVSYVGNTNVDPELDANTWKLVEIGSATEGQGSSGFLSFDSASGSIITSKNVLSMSQVSAGAYITENEIILDPSIAAAAGTKNLFIVSHSSVGIDLSGVDANATGYPNNHSLAFGVALNSGNTIKLVNNGPVVLNKTFRVDIQFFNVT